MKDPADDLQKIPHTLFPSGRTNPRSLRRRIVDNVSGDPHACIADVDVRSCDELLDFVLVLSAKGTTQIAAHLSPPLNDLTTPNGLALQRRGASRPAEFYAERGAEGRASERYRVRWKRELDDVRCVEPICCGVTFEGTVTEVEEEVPGWAARRSGERDPISY